MKIYDSIWKGFGFHMVALGYGWVDRLHRYLEWFVNHYHAYSFDMHAIAYLPLAVLSAGSSHVAAGTVSVLGGIFISRRMIMHHDHCVVIQFRCIGTTDGIQ